VTYDAPTVINFTVTNPTDVNWTIVNKVTGEKFTGTGLDNITKALAAGNYTITIDNAETVNITGSTASADFTVNKAASSLDADDVVFDYGGSNFTDVTYDGASNVTAFVVDHGEAVVAVGDHVVTVSGLAAGEYILNITTVADGNHTAVSKLVNVTVNKVASTLDADNISFILDKSGNTTVAYTGATNVTAVVVGHSEAVVAVGDHVITVSGLAIGNYTMNITTVPDSNHTAVSMMVNVTVLHDDDFDMNTSSDSPIVGDDGTVSIELPEDAEGNVTVTLANGTNYTAKVENGTVVLDIPGLPEGDNNVTITYSGDDRYAGKTVNATIHVKKILIEAADMKRGWDSPYDYLAKLVDEDGDPVKGKSISFTVNGEQYSVKTDSNGVAKLTKSKLPVGNYTIVSAYLANGASATQNLEIVKRLLENKDITMDYKDGHKYTVLAIGDDGNPVGKDVVVKISANGKTYDIKTDKNGYAKLPINLIPKKYTVTAKYWNTQVKNKLVVKQVLTFNTKNIKVKKGKKITLKATLKWTNGKPIKGKTIKFHYKSKFFKAKTNAKGVAKVVIKDKKFLKNVKKGKTYTSSARYIKDIIKGKVKIKKK
jgi:hypothetical protein